MPASKTGLSNPGRPKRVTLQDIAKVADVHVMTVSDALNGTRSVAPATRERVRRIAKELNYIPNSAARALVTGRTGLIAILSGPISEPYYANMVHLLQKHINAAGLKLMLLRTSGEIKELVSATGHIAVDGAIAVDRLELVDEFRAHSNIPCVSIGTYQPSFVDSVSVDLGHSVGQALDIMRQNGRNRVAYLVTAAHMGRPTEVRAQAYLAALEKTGQTPEIIDLDTDSIALAKTRLQTYFEAKGVPDALLCQNDETAMCAYRVLRDWGCRVPEDVLLVGCDGQLHMEYFDPPLSTISQPMEEMCAQAWQFLQRRLANPDLPLQQATLQGKLLIRPSLGPPVLE